MQVSKSVNTFVFLLKASFFIMLVTFSRPLFAEYYLVREVQPISHVYCRAHHKNHYHRHHDRSKLIHPFFQQRQHSKKTKSHHARIYIPLHHSNENLDMITGDDDPYVYPGMNIDR